MSLPEVTEIQRWKLEPGDRLIVATDRVVSLSDVERIKERVRAALALPADFPVLVHGTDATVEVVNV